jgi:hypothetical protein
MILRKNILLMLLVPYVVACSTTPGDAAYRGGHPEQAANLYMKGAELGDKTAADKLGLMISQREVSAEKYGNAIKWFVRACDLGSNAGCHNSGHAHEYGEVGANKDYNKARDYYLIAADKGFMQSQYNLGSLYSNQYFHNDVEGLKWMLLAERTANTCAKVPLCKWVMDDPPGHRTKLKNRMTKNQIAEAEQLANQWKSNK